MVLLHGLALWPGFMAPMARRLRRRGWSVRIVGYDSRRQDLAASVAQVRGRLDPGQALHLVGHSLGGLIAAALLRDPRGLQIGRVVQIGSPNLGSRRAARAQAILPLRRFYGPVLADLHCHRNAPDPNDGIGAIAGAIRPDLWGSRGDGTVGRTSALAGAGHHVTVRVMHTLLPLSAEVASHAAGFLADGRFDGPER